MVNFSVLKRTVPTKLADQVDLVFIYFTLLVSSLAHLSFTCHLELPIAMSPYVFTQIAPNDFFFMYAD